MKKIYILLLFFAVVSASLFIPFTQSKTVVITKEFLSVYQQFISASKWVKWQPDLKKAATTDSGSVSYNHKANNFIIKSPGMQLSVATIGNAIAVEEQKKFSSASFGYLLSPDKVPNKTIITTYVNTYVLKYLISFFNRSVFAETHIDDFKNYIENDSLYYGYKILKVKVPQSDLITAYKTVLQKDKFTAAAALRTILEKFIAANHVKQLYPVIAQFLTKSADSVQVKVGFFIDKQVLSKAGVAYVKMPIHGTLVAAKYVGEI